MAVGQASYPIPGEHNSPDREKPTPPIEGSVTAAKGNDASIRLPETPGNYRIFVYAFDAAGNAATANVPVMIK